MQRREFRHKLGICARLFGRKLAAQGICWVRTSPGPVWKLDLRNPTHRWIVYGAYEGPGFWRWLERRQSSITTVVDSGANIGQTVLYFAALTPQARVFAYEPGLAARSWLAECVALNRLGKVEVSDAGLGASAGMARLSEDGGDAALHGSWNKVNTSTGHSIRLVTLDDELDRLGLAKLDLWKLDMEGYETFALQGAARSLAAHRIRAIHLEIAGEAGQECLNRVSACGYRIYGIDDHGRPVAWNPQHSYDNAMCFAPGEETS